MTFQVTTKITEFYSDDCSTACNYRKKRLKQNQKKRRMTL